MISSEVQRTLVKSPPELWAELSDPAALARHLGELGEIHITRTEPEKTVEWEAENTTGTVSIQASGWGTKVILSVTRESVGPPPEAKSPPQADVVAAVPDASAVPDVSAGPQATSEPEAVSEPRAEAIAEPKDAVADPTLQATPEPQADAAPEPQPRRGFFARLFGRRRQVEKIEPEPCEEATIERPSGSSDAFAAVRAALAQGNLAAIDPFAVRRIAQPALAATELEQTPEAERIVDISAELMAAEEVAAEEVTAVLAAVLDRLGAAHHRPFSRS
jgi:hypothetical protein